MLKHVEETSPTTRKLTIDIPFFIIEKEITNAYNKLRTTAKIPGFRAGKAPQSILEKKFGKNIEAQVMEKIIPELYTEAVEEARILPITYPEIDGKFEFVKDQALSFTAVVEIKPEIKELNYEGITLKERTFSIAESEIEAAVGSLRESRAVLQVTDGPIHEGDLSVIDCAASADGEELPELASRDYPFVIGSSSMPKEFSEALSDKKKGERFEIKIPFAPDIPDKAFAGKEVLFKVAVKELKERVLPELDDEFAKSFQYGSMEELKKNVKESIEKHKKNRIANEYKKEIIERLVGAHDVELPKSMVKKEIEFQINEAHQNAMRTGSNLAPDEELAKQYESIAQKNVKEMLLIDTIGKKEKVEVSEEEIKKAVDGIALQHGIKPEDVKKLYMLKDGTLNGLKHSLYANKVLDLILSKTVIKK